MHIIFFNTKGGVSKSTLCEYTSIELQRLGYSVHVDNTDQQRHVTLIENEEADFFLYDTAGAFTADNVDLLKAASGKDKISVSSDDNFVRNHARAFGRDVISISELKGIIMLKKKPSGGKIKEKDLEIDKIKDINEELKKHWRL